MKPPPFEYHAPATVEEALQLLAGGNGTYALAGGQSLVQLMKFRQVKPSALVDLNGVAGLDALEERDGELHVGALVRQQRLLEDELVGASWPLLREAARFVGYKETRRRGTVGGSLAFAAPWAELTAAAVALDAAIDVRSLNAERTIPGALVLPRPERDRARAGRADRPRALPLSAGTVGGRVPRGQRPLPRLLPGRGRGGRLARRSGRPRPPPRRADAVPRRRLERARGRRSARRAFSPGSSRRTTSRSPPRTDAVSLPSSPAERCATPPKTPDRRENA